MTNDFQCDSREGRVCSAAVQTVVTLTKLVSPLAMQQCLKFLYTGTIDTGKLCEIAVSTLFFYKFIQIWPNYKSESWVKIVLYFSLFLHLDCCW